MDSDFKTKMKKCLKRTFQTSRTSTMKHEKFKNGFAAILIQTPKGGIGALLTHQHPAALQMMKMWYAVCGTITIEEYP